VALNEIETVAVARDERPLFIIMTSDRTWVLWVCPSSLRYANVPFIVLSPQEALS
jgi:hypothetical protein